MVPESNRQCAAPRRRWRGPQRRIGLTGGIATGKSTVAAMLSDRHGLPVLDADVYARQLLTPGTAVSRAVLDRYGLQVQTPSGGLDRPALGRIVFARPTERRWLEALTHPLVKDAFTRDLARHHRGATVVLVAPLLLEAGLETLCSEVWLVDLDEATQLARLLARDPLSPHEARQRIRAQWPLARKRGLADVILRNHSDRGALARQVAMACSARATAT
ncbi:MAG: dephospho-CoA kinase [Cyanobacteria bacterium MAG CAR2_bin_4]|nr:dephospho-CoA kinase [Cyanobacteria bacterium MAG CAR2_bin_4]